MIARIRSDMVDRIWRGLFMLAVVGVPISVSRSLFTGWLPMYAAHLVIGGLVVLGFVYRHQMAYMARVGLIVLCFWAVGLTGAFTLGLLGAGLWWLSMSTLIVSVLISIRWGVVALAVATLVLCIVAAGFISGVLGLHFDANEYVRLPASWLTLLVGTTVMPVIVFFAIAGYQQATEDLLQQVEAQRVKIEHLATHDALTGLPTGAVAQDRLRQALISRLRRKRKVALLFLDLDGFKAVNDGHGHEAGDVVLQQVAQRLRGGVRAQDTVSRKSGDEFTLILEDILDTESALLLARKLREAVAQPIAWNETHLTVGASIGVALAPDHALDEAELMRRADAAMYAAKAKGKNRVCLAKRERG